MHMCAHALAHVHTLARAGTPVPVSSTQGPGSVASAAREAGGCPHGTHCAKAGLTALTFLLETAKLTTAEGTH